MKFIITIFFASFFIISCAKDSSFENRSNNFLSLLPQEESSAFTNGNFPPVISYLENKIKKNETFSNNYQSILDHEGISLFSPTQTVQFFYRSIYYSTKKR